MSIPANTTATYPACPVITRSVQIGGETKAQLLMRLTQRSVKLNKAAELLFASEKFTTSEIPKHLRTVELTVRNLGFPQGATLPELSAGAAAFGLRLCPLELAPHLRLQFLDQPEGFLGQPLCRNRSPPGSITIASDVLSPDDGFPKGFYLRRIEGVLWLRGYWSHQEHLCDPDDHFIFHQP